MLLFGRKNKDKKEKTAKQIKKNSLVISCPVFGVELGETVKNNESFDGVPISAAIRSCIDYVEIHGMEVEGIYRVSPPKSRLDELEIAINTGGITKSIKFLDSHEAAGLLKRFLRQLPNHILLAELRSKFESSASKCQCNSQEPCSCSCVQSLNELLKKLPKENYYLLAYVFIHARLIVEKEKFNKMNLGAIGILLQAMLNLTKNEVRIFLLNSSRRSRHIDSNTYQTPTHLELFDDVDFKPYVSPKTLAELESTNWLSNNSDALDAELKKQQRLREALLAYLSTNSRLLRNNAASTASTDDDQEQLEETQRIIGLLTEKLNEIRQPSVSEGAKIKGQQDLHENVELPHSSNEIDNNNINSAVNNNSANSHTDDGGAKINTVDAVNSALLEKHLLAVQHSLKEEIAEEKRRITQLLSRLRDIHRQMPPDALERLNALRQLKPAMEMNGVRILAESCVDEQCSAEERRQKELLDEVIRLRNLCAELRANLEHDTVLLSNCNRGHVIHNPIVNGLKSDVVANGGDAADKKIIVGEGDGGRRTANDINNAEGALIVADEQTSAEDPLSDSAARHSGGGGSAGALLVTRF